jgi:ABC-type Mn2+/Zn2+ transport system permease subunit
LCIEPEIAATSGFNPRRYQSLMLMFVAVAIISSFQSVGTLLVFGMLLAPASTAALVTRRLSAMVAMAALLGSLSTYVGLLLSYHADLAAGASVVAVAVAIFLVTFAGVEIRTGIARRRGAPVPIPVHGHGHAHDHPHAHSHTEPAGGEPR